MPLLRIDDINLSFGGVKAINGVSINVEKGSIHAIIGPNGAGKTSIFNCISSVYKPQRGAVYFEDRKVTGMKPGGPLAYGLRRRVELGRALALKPKLLLLDEPMAGMNLEEKEDMARFILDINEEWGVTILLIEHDLGVVMDISHRVSVLDFGVKISEGEPAEVANDPRVIKAYIGEEDDFLREMEAR